MFNISEKFYEFLKTNKTQVFDVGTAECTPYLFRVSSLSYGKVLHTEPAGAA